jgi:IMP dehydrogenase
MAGNKAALFEHLDKEFLAVTFDELTIQNEVRSELDWRDVDLSSPISRNIIAPVPILTSPMTTITETNMAIAAAKEGGGGVIHHANSPEEQKKMVTKVKLHLNGIIEEPITIPAHQTTEKALEDAENAGHKFTTFPVTDENGRYVGLMTKAQFKMFRGTGTKVEDAMLPLDATPTAAADTDPHAALRIMRAQRLGVVTLLSASRHVEGLYVIDDVLNVVEGNPQGYNLDNAGRLRTFMSVSTYDGDARARVEASGKYLDMVVVDTSHGESKYSFATLKEMRALRKLVKGLREDHAGIDIMVGNVSDPTVAVQLAEEGPDAIRVGRGPGGICISREKLGGGTPQATAIYEIRKAIRDIDPDIQIIADGGVRGPGDFVKALALDAAGIMIGGYVAGTDEAAAPVMDRADGSQYKEYNGMGSGKEQRRSMAARNRYGVGMDAADEDLFVEGVEKEVPLQGPVSRKFRELVRGAKMEMCTGGFPNIAALQAGVNFKRVTVAGVAEGQARR